MSEQDNIQEGFIKKAVRAVAGKQIAASRAKEIYKRQRSYAPDIKAGETWSDQDKKDLSVMQNAKRRYSRIAKGEKPFRKPKDGEYISKIGEEVVEEGFIKRAVRAVAGKYIARERSKEHHSAAMKGIVSATQPGKSPEEVGAAMRDSSRHRRAERKLSNVAKGRPIPTFGTRKEDIEMTSEIINILESAEPHNLKEAVYAALTQKMMEALDEYKLVVARSYFGQDLAEGALKGFKAQDLAAKEKERLEKPKRKPYQRIKQGLNTHNLTTYSPSAKKATGKKED